MVIAAAIWQRPDGHDVKEAETTVLLLAIQFAHNTEVDHVSRMSNWAVYWLTQNATREADHVWIGEIHNF
ncbi:hypothetical protein QL285_085266 [Trifolium repens]|nr:hypothetical protein QL285_085266 [Trifolium repens]